MPEKKKSPVRVLLIILLVLALLAAAAWCVVSIAYKHRSDPADVLHFKTSNPHITAGRTLISAHRSGAGIAPEETMRAFRNCIEDGSFDVDYFEFDLHITKDDVLVLLHDAELDRTSDCKTVFGAEHCRPEDYTFAELRRLNMGAKFVDPDGAMPYAGLSGDAVPDDLRILDLDTILDYLESIKPFRYIIEVKNGGDLGKRSVDILYQSLKQRSMVDRVVFGSFQDEVSLYKDEKYPDLMRGAFAKEVAQFYLASLLSRKDYEPAFRVLQLPFGLPGNDYHLNLATAHILNYAHAHDLAVQYWTVNNAEDAAYLMSIGADCIMSDYPDMAYEVSHGDGSF